MEVAATWEYFQSSNDFGDIDRVLYYASAELKNLTPEAYYQYRVGSMEFGWSSDFFFQAKRNFEPNTPVKFILYGDLGVGEQVEETMASLKKDLASHQYEAIIHFGDFAYNLGSDLGKVGDIFMETIEPVAAFLPYMVTQGNHEVSWVNNPGQYEKRFKMPGNTTNLWYSFTGGQVYFVAFTDELVFQQRNETQKEQMEWLEAELKSIDREQYPWVVGLSHRPMYCSADMTKEATDEEGYEELGVRWIRSNPDCIQQATTVRETFEELFYKQGVDLLINGHVHGYERLGPAYQNQSMGCTEETLHTCVGAKAPITIISGIPGQDESYAPASPTPLPWSLVQDAEKGTDDLQSITRRIYTGNRSVQ